MASITPSLSTETITNFRDVAKLTNASSTPNQPTLNPGLFYRSALPSTASPSARENLSKIYHIKTILDLRTDTELSEQEKQHQPQPKPTKHAKTPSTSSFSPSSYPHPLPFYLFSFPDAQEEV
jgi:protein tyrosine/serine phosphatase